MLIRTLLALLFILLAAVSVAAQDDPLTVFELTLVTGDDGTEDDPLLTVSGRRADGEPHRMMLALNNVEDLQAGATDTYTITLRASFCDISGFQIRASGTDSWTPDAIYIRYGGIDVYADEDAEVFAPVTVDSYPINGRWSRTSAYLAECAPDQLPPPIVPQAGAQIVVVTPPVLATATLSLTAVPTPTVCPGFLPSRLIVGQNGRVTPGAPNNLRNAPARSGGLIGQIPGGDVFRVLAGPQCDPDGIAWWEVDYNGNVGWTAEGMGADYFVEPAP